MKIIIKKIQNLGMNKNALKLSKNLQINAIYGTTQFASMAKINIFGFFFQYQGTEFFF